LAHEGHRVLEYKRKGIPPRPSDLAALNCVLDKVLIAVSILWNRLPTVKRDESLNPRLAELHLAGGTKALFALVVEKGKDCPFKPSHISPADSPSIDSPEGQAIRKRFLDRKGKAEDILPQRPRFLQYSNRHLAIAAAERASAERQKSEVFSTPQLRSPPATDQYDQTEAPALPTSEKLDKTAGL
jgi:hypothetical protein